MSAHVLITLDTTAPTLSVEGTQDPGDPTAVTLALATNDGIEIRVWGAIDPTSPTNAMYAEEQADAPWFDFTDTLALRVHPQGGRIFVSVRDDVWNERTKDLRINTGAEPPPLTGPPPELFPPSGEPARRPRVETRTVVSTSRVVVATSAVVRRSGESRSRVVVRSDQVVGARRVDTSQVGYLALERISRSRASSTSRVGVLTRPALGRRPEGPDQEAILILLDLL